MLDVHVYVRLHMYTHAHVDALQFRLAVEVQLLDLLFFLYLRCIYYSNILLNFLPPIILKSMLTQPLKAHKQPSTKPVNPLGFQYIA